jgi:hypothetical protein
VDIEGVEDALAVFGVRKPAGEVAEKAERGMSNAVLGLGESERDWRKEVW